MFSRIINFSIQNKLIVLLFTAALIGFGLYSLSHISIGAVPDVTNNQVQVITTSRNLATEEIEKFVTAPVELEMANLPGVKEIRSISKFGLSVVTVVFDDDMGTYLPRQLIAEKIKSAEEKIPAGFGSPFMGPVSTGLGEIYQYILDVEPAFKDQYSVTELRTIQDWIVKRQLSGIPGVVEINTWGGYLKTYEVAIDPERIKLMNISITDVYRALTLNNSVVGGSYIEKTNEAFFIRADGLVASISDIENIVIDTRDKFPIFIKDVAQVQIGHATRFGAITGNGEGEKVLGQVMMLKGASSKKVIDNVKERVAEIQKTLPEGVFINPFLERSELIGRTTSTIEENLILGCLIVLFVVIILLGNIRSGLVIGSVIPLCLLFAISLMYLFGVDANLMSLGAIDFGIIIDGAVIIVEYVSFKISQNSSELLKLSQENRKAEVNRLTTHSATKMMHSALFGQLIIIIVFIPILTLTGVEGKMFKPMAMTFCFALIGAMIMCFTYVPVMASIFIKPHDNSKADMSKKLMNGLDAMYRPIIRLALHAKAVVILIALAMLLCAVILFNKMGAEFVPTLDEGDFVIQPVLKTGLSLSRTVEMTTHIEQILRKIPEVKQVVSRIGAAEVPTDPMSMEESDVIITLKPLKEWSSASTKDELAEVLKSAIEKEIAGIEIEFTQPIEMRFNELITGTRADLAIKIFGEDLNLLYRKGMEIKNAIADVAGAADIVLEKTEGLPQIAINYDREQIARYGMNVSELGEIISLAFAGKTAGIIFEGEKQFDLVVKYAKSSRQDIESVKNMLVTVPGGEQYPISLFADISERTGPAKISRDDTNRRIVVGINVRGRDLQSVVDDVQQIIKRDIKLPPGYIIRYGGQFENLQSASRRLLIVVPIALFLILLMLYFVFNSIKDTLMIFTAIPFAAVGGIFLLYARDMPFSISAGVGFIALFGIAVLNGIVLIEHLKELKSGSYDLKELVIKGTSERLRPVLLTASAAALGFLPMAISTSAGAEVQKPLATVVIGGLITATFLTLVILPVIFYYVETWSVKRLAVKPLVMILGLMLLNSNSWSQRMIPLQEALFIAQENNTDLKIIELKGEKYSKEIEGYRDMGKTNIYYSYDHNNVAENGRALHVLGLDQNFKTGGYHKARKELLLADRELQMTDLDLINVEILKNINHIYNDIHYWSALINKYSYLDSLYSKSLEDSERKMRLGENAKLAVLSSMAKSNKAKMEIELLASQRLRSIEQLKKYLLIEEEIDVPVVEYDEQSMILLDLLEHPSVTRQKNMIEKVDKDYILTTKQKSPEISISVFSGQNSFRNFEWYPGINIGTNIPIWMKYYKSAEASAQIDKSIEELRLLQVERSIEADRRILLAELEMYRVVLDTYYNRDRQMKTDLINYAEASFSSGEIDFDEFIAVLAQAAEIELTFLNNLYAYNAAVININYVLY